MLMGLLYTFLTFLICFILVCAVKLIYLGLLSLKKPPEPEKKPEPVYYIVERKRTKKKYSNPQEFEFKK